MPNSFYLIHLETSGNQAYVFSTNKLRNIVGASELLYRVGTLYVEKALKALGNNFSIESILAETKIEADLQKNFELIIATSGKALLLARTEELAKKFINEWSKIVTKEAPGVDATAVYSNIAVDPTKPLGNFVTAFKDTHTLFNSAKMRKPSSQARFQRIPIVAPCAYSSLPASQLEDANTPVSLSIVAQRNACRDKKHFIPRINKLFGLDNSSSNKEKRVLSFDGLDLLEDKDWIGIVHADGNGLGQLFINFDRLVHGLRPNATGRDYIDYYRKFSTALDYISQQSFKKAVDETWPGDVNADIVPVVVGGDDLTAVMDGYKVIDFTNRFMKHFCEQTREHKDIKPVLQAEPDANKKLSRLGMCAGIAISKPHFPFSQSYHLAEQLMQKAKGVKNQFGADSIALDFHILYDSTSASLDTIRSRLHLPDNLILTAKPLVVEKGSGKPQSTDANNNKKWDEVHDFSLFEKAVSAISSKNNKNVPNLPSSQAHAVREALFAQSLGTQESEWKFLLQKYPEFAKLWKKSGGMEEQLYQHIGNEYYTCFLDALEAAKFFADDASSSANDSAVPPKSQNH